MESLDFNGHALEGAAQSVRARGLRLHLRGRAGHLDRCPPPQQRQRITSILNTCCKQQYFTSLLLLLAESFINGKIWFIAPWKSIKITILMRWHKSVVSHLSCNAWFILSSLKDCVSFKKRDTIWLLISDMKYIRDSVPPVWHGRHRTGPSDWSLSMCCEQSSHTEPAAGRRARRTPSLRHKETQP